jgi:Ca2+/Na+ antiporter
MSDFRGFIKWIASNLYNNLGWILYFIFIVLAGYVLPGFIAAMVLLLSVLAAFLYVSYDYYIGIKEIEEKYKK